MKRLRTTICVLLTSLLATQAIAQERGGQRQGGLSGGGGSLATRYPVTQDEVRQGILRMGTLAPLALNGLEFLAMARGTSLTFENALTKLRRESESLRARLPRITHEFRVDRLCEDPNGNLVPASAIHTEDGKDILCFHLPELAKNVDRASLEKDLLGLYIHELSHLADTSEEEADALQSTISNSYLAGNVSRALSEQLMFFLVDLDRTLQSLRVDRDSILLARSSHRAHSVAAHLCSSLIPNLQQRRIGIEKLLELRSLSSAVSLLSPRDHSKILLAALRTTMSTYACVDRSAGSSAAPYDAIFAGARQIAGEKFVASLGVANFFDRRLAETSVVRHIEYGNFETVQSELDDSISLLQEVKVQLEQNLSALQNL